MGTEDGMRISLKIQQKKQHYVCQQFTLLQHCPITSQMIPLHKKLKYEVN